MPKFRSKTKKGEESDTPESVSREQHAAGLEQVAVADTGAEVDETTTVAGAREVGAEFAGADLAEDELAEQIAQTTGGGPDEDQDASADPFGEGKERGSYEEFIGGDDDGDGGLTSFEDRLEAMKAAGEAAGLSPTPGSAGNPSGGTQGAGTGVGADPGWGNPLRGYGESDPLGGFNDYVEAKTGIDDGPAADQGIPDGKPSVAAGGTGEAYNDNKYYALNSDKTAGYLRNDENGISVFTGSDGSVEVTNKNNGTITTLYADGSTKTTTLGGATVDETDPLKQPADPDAPYRATLEEKAADPLFRQYHQAKNAGGGGDGATDPSEHEDAPLGGPAVSLADFGTGMIDQVGQPPPGEDFGGDRDTPSDAGYWNDPNHGAIDPGEDQELAGGPQRTEDPADATAGGDPVAGMPADDEAETDDGGGSFLPPGDFTPVDAPPDLPDDVEIGGPTG